MAEQLGHDTFQSLPYITSLRMGRDVELVRNMMAHAQIPDLVFQRNGRVHLNRRGCQFSRLLAVECGSADSNCIDRAPSSSSRLLATHSICIFPLHFPSRALPCAIRFRTRYTSTCQFAFMGCAGTAILLPLIFLYHAFENVRL